MRNNSDGRGNLLGMALLSMLICSGDTFIVTAPTTAAQFLRQEHSDSSMRVMRVISRSRSPTMMANVPLNPGFPSFDPLSWIQNKRDCLGHLADSYVTSHRQIEHDANERQSRSESAELSSKLTLDYYFRNMKTTTTLRFDELSSQSSREHLLCFAEENCIAVDHGLDSAGMYDRITEALQADDAPNCSVTGGSRRMEPFVEYGKLNPMPKTPSCQENVKTLTSDVLQAYGVPSDSLHFSIAAELDAMGISYSSDFTIHNGELYMDCMLQAGVGGARVLIMSRDSHFFAPGTKETTSYVKMKSKSLRSMGYSVTSVPYFEWEQLPTRGQRVAYLSGKLARNGFFGEGGGIFGESAIKIKSIMRSAR